MFAGRSYVAGIKPRIKGKFVKLEEFEKFKQENKSNASIS